MRLLEIHDVGRSPEQRKRAATAVTEAVVRAYGVPAATVDVVFHRHSEQSYARAGVLPAPADMQRTYVQLHAFQRPLERRRQVAQLLTAALSESFDLESGSIVIYFQNRARDEAAHGGVLAIDEAET